MRSRRGIAAAGISLVVCLAAGAARAERWLLPKVHAPGVEPSTAASFEILLVHALEARAGERLVRSSGAEVCADAACAGRLARSMDVDAALLCTLARLGDEHVVTLQRIDAAGRIAWSQQLVAPRAEGLDEAARDLAQALVGGPRTTPGQVDTESPASGPRRGRSSQGPRVGTLRPLAGSYAGVSRLTALAYVWRYQTPHFDIESVPALGFAWGSAPEDAGAKARDWTLLDVYLAWTPFSGDVAPYVGAGLGFHGVRLERSGGGPGREQAAMSMVLLLGGGLALFRTYDFQIGIDLRYQRVLDDFLEAGGGGAHGLALTFGVHHR